MKIILFIFLFPFFIFSFWSISFGFLSGILGFLILSIGFYFTLKTNCKLYCLFILLFFLINVLFFGNTVNTYTLKIDDYFQRVSSGQHLNTREKVNIYGLNLVMSILGYPLYPEVSKETFFLLFPTKDGMREFEDDFFMKSQKIHNAFKDLKNGKEEIVFWKTTDYIIGNPESRYALALNPCNISFQKNGKMKTYSVKVRVEYPAKARVTLTNFPFTIIVEEGLFHYLQKIGWLFPYTAKWNFHRNE